MQRNIELEEEIRKKILKQSPYVDDEYVDAFLELIFESCPQELEQNIWEWIEDKPYSDIKYCGLSINDLFAMGYDKEQFFRAIDVLNRINITLHGKYDMKLINILYRTSSYRS